MVILVFSGGFKDEIKWGKHIQNPYSLPLSVAAKTQKPATSR